MSRAFWFAAGTGAIVAAVLINQWASTQTDAAIIATILLWAVFVLAGIDVFRSRRERSGPKA